MRDVSVLLNYFQINHSRIPTQSIPVFYTTASTQSFREIAMNWLNTDIDVRHVDLQAQDEGVGLENDG